MSDLSDQLSRILGSTYRIEKELGGGGMSRVFLAEETGLARRVVVKVLPPEMAAGVNQDRFRREIQLAARAFAGLGVVAAGYMAMRNTASARSGA